MYLAPLNYDRYFKKVFSDLNIAKRFLEDFLDIEIQEIELLPLKKSVTDSARFVEFDFRCKIDDLYVIIDMQQWYKPDIIKRFYVYNSLNSALQLESFSKKLIELPNGKVKEIKDYKELIPVITIIWLVHDTLNFKEDFVSYSLTPEQVVTFAQDAKLWKNPKIEKIVIERNKVLKIQNNNTKNLLWMRENKLIYVFQKNIVKNEHFSKYKNWFEFAEKTLQKISDKFAYDKYEDNSVFSEMIRRLKQEIESKEEIKYIQDYDDYLAKVLRYDQGIRQESLAEGRREGIETGRVEGKKEGIKEGKKEAEAELRPLIEAERNKAEAELDILFIVL